MSETKQKPKETITEWAVLDIFATQALTGLVANPHVDPTDITAIAEKAYALATAMVVERQVRLKP